MAEGARQIPLLFTFQSLLTDEGGNPLQDTVTNLKFQILDSSGNVLYEEFQEIEAVNGEVSAIIGNGLTAGGAPAGGIPSDIFDPVDSRYLQVEAAGHKPYDRLEIVAVPYSLWADTALRLPAGAVTAEMIAKGAITKDHLDAELFKTVFPNGLPKDMLPSDTIYKSDFESFRDTIQSTYGAGKVGVVSPFIYSGSQTVQGVLKDLDTAIKKRQEEVNWAKGDYDKKIGNEASARAAADTTLQTNINNEASARAAADTTLQTNINNEISARAAADSSLQSQLTSHANATSAHGSNGDVVGVNNSQYLYNKVLVAPLIKSGNNINPEVDAQFDIAVGEGMIIDGNLMVTGSIQSKEIKASTIPSFNASVGTTANLYISPFTLIEDDGGERDIALFTIPGLSSKRILCEWFINGTDVSALVEMMGSVVLPPSGDITASRIQWSGEDGYIDYAVLHVQGDTVFLRYDMRGFNRSFDMGGFFKLTRALK